jgi:lipopolysaccharide biosynthesis glycosyltransferase
MFFNKPFPKNVWINLFTGNKKDVVDHSINDLYNEIKKIKIIPFREVKSRLRDDNQETAVGNDVREFVNFIEKETHLDRDNFHETYHRHNIVRRFVKLHWLINAANNDGIEDPLQVVVHPVVDKQPTNLNYIWNVHPGTHRWMVSSLLDLNDPIIVYDPFDVFYDYPNVSLTDVLDLFTNDEFDILLLPTNTRFLIPDIDNKAKDSVHRNMHNLMTDWVENNVELYNKPWKIFIGYDSRHENSAEVCKQSILDTFQIGSKNNISIEFIDKSKIPEYTREYGNQSTEFTYTRFLVPYLSNYEGISIFVDDDFIFTRDICSLFLHIDSTKSVACVKHDFENKYESKFVDDKDVWYPKKLWSSLMVFNNAHPDCKKLTPELINTQNGQYLHRFEWTSDENIAPLPHKWNWCEGYSSLDSFDDAAGIHFTRGGPWIKDFDYNDVHKIQVWQYIANKELFLAHNDQVLPYIGMINLRDFYDFDNALSKNGEISPIPLRNDFTE